jgi:ATP-dependent DNA ligase
MTDDAPTLWDTWASMGGEGIVLKEKTSVYRRASARRPG